MSKAELRRRALEARRSLSHEELARLSSRVRGNLVSTPEYGRATTIACYVAKDDEVQTAAIIEGAIRGGKGVIVPLTSPDSGTLAFSFISGLDELKPGHFGVMEPDPAVAKWARLSDAELVLVPVVGWDERGLRLGYGKGYYDRALATASGVVRFGLAFECQRVPFIPSTPGDIPLQALVTEERVLRFGG